MSVPHNKLTKVQSVISDLKNLENEIVNLKSELSHANKNFSSLFSSLPQVTFIIDKNGYITDCCPKAESVYFLSRNKLLGSKLSDYHDPSSTIDFKNTLRRLEEENSFEEEIQIRNGIGLTLEMHRTYIPYPGNDDNSLAIIYDTDITEKKRIEEVVHLHSSALEATAVSTVITNISGDVVWINSAFTELTGYTKDEMLYKNVRILKSGKHEDAFYKNMWDTILEGKVWHGEIINLHKEGYFYNEEQTITPVFNKEGAITHFIGVKQNVTERKKWEKKIQGLNEELERRVERRTIQLEEANEKLNQYINLIEEDLEAGKKIQSRLLPDQHKEYQDYEFSRYLHPSLYLSGDFLDYFTIDQNHVGFYFADVCGHGASSAFVTVFLKAFIDGYLKKYKREGIEVILNPEQLLGKLNLDLLDENLDKHLTIFYGVLDISSNKITYINCGNFPYPIIFDGNNTIVLNQKGSIPIGFYKKAEFENKQIDLPDKFVMLMVSDGILEIMPQEFIHEKQAYLEKLITKLDITVTELIELLSIEQNDVIPDDITLLMIKK